LDTSNPRIFSAHPDSTPSKPGPSTLLRHQPAPKPAGTLVRHGGVKQEPSDILVASTQEEEPKGEPDPSDPEDAEAIADTSDDDSDSEMTTIEFTGKTGTLANLITHCKVVFLSRPSKYTTATSKTGFIASHFKGQALDWLTQEWKANPELLDDYDDFLSELDNVYEASTATQKQAADQQLRKLRQTGSATAYALKFDSLVSLLGYNDAAKQAAFIVGLKTDVRKSLAGDTWDSYASMRSTAINVDESLYTLRGPRRREKKGKHLAIEGRKN
jgi:hypothetical protein